MQRTIAYTARTIGIMLANGRYSAARAELQSFIAERQHLTDIPLCEVLTDERDLQTLELLVSAGYHTAQQVASNPDEKLKRIKGIRGIKLAKIRQLTRQAIRNAQGIAVSSSAQTTSSSLNSGSTN